MRAHILMLIFLAGCAYSLEPHFNISNETRVFEVVDGDTFIISGGEYVRLIGIDAPEKGDEGYYEAADFLVNLSEGNVVILEREGTDRDRYGRLLRHAYIDNKSLSVELLKNKHAIIYSGYNGSHYQEFETASK